MIQTPVAAGTKIAGNPNANGEFEQAVGPSADQDPIFDHPNGTKNAVTTTAVVIVPPVGCKYVRIDASADIVVDTSGASTVLDDGKSIRIVANQPEVVPVTPGTSVRALSLSGSATVRCMPLKVRS